MKWIIALLCFNLIQIVRPRKNVTAPKPLVENPNFIRDRIRESIWKPMMNESWTKRFKKPFNPAWMDWCDPYHCNDYHKIACGLNRKTDRFKWFQSRCHLVLSNMCSTYRGSLKYDIVDNKYCSIYVMFLRLGCPSVCANTLKPICGVSLIDNHLVLFQNRCAFERRNCQGGILEAIFSIHNCKQTKTTIPLRHRIEILRNRLKDEIKQQIFENEDTKDKFEFSEENYDYFEHRKKDKITPFMDSKIKRHKKRKNRTPSINNTMKITSELSNVTNSQLSTHKLLRSKIKKKKVKKPLDIFYRRSLNDDRINEEIPWAHCHYMITPYLSGVKKDINTSKGLGPNDSTVVRLIQLLSMNTTEMAKEDIYSILYQISHLHIRLYQWDVPPIKMLLNVVIRDKIHSFRTLKHGIQTLFSEWKLDISNASSLLKQTRLFRPPCVRVSDLDGSTKSPRVTLYPKKLSQPTKCPDDDDDDDDD